MNAELIIELLLFAAKVTCYTIFIFIIIALIFSALGI